MENIPGHREKEGASGARERQAGPGCRAPAAARRRELDARGNVEPLNGEATALQVCFKGGHSWHHRQAVTWAVQVWAEGSQDEAAPETPG